MPAEGIPKGLNAMRFTSQTSSDGVREQLFILGEIPGALWTPAGAAGTRPLILMGHGGLRLRREDAARQPGQAR